MRQHEAARALAAGEPLVSFFPSPPAAEERKRGKLQCALWPRAAGGVRTRSPSERKSHPWVRCVRETLKMQALIGYYPWLVGLFTRLILIFLARTAGRVRMDPSHIYIFCSLLAKGKLLCAPRRAT